MGKFDGLLLCTDLDDTLLTTDKKVSDKNKEAIEYFKSEGGMFTFVTGRVPLGALPVLDMITPNAPSVCFNGGAVYDFNKREILWSRSLDTGAVEVAEFVDANFPTAGIEVCTEDKVYFCKVNRIVEEHKINERFPDNPASYHDIPEKWCKTLFMVEVEEMAALRNLLDNSPYAERYSFVRSSPNYYELLPKGSNKGEGLKKLAEIMGIRRRHVIAMGDNENDLEMVRTAGVGIAVGNAVENVKRAAKYITVDNNSDAASRVIHDIENGKIAI